MLRIRIANKILSEFFANIDEMMETEVTFIVLRVNKDEQ